MRSTAIGKRSQRPLARTFAKARRFPARLQARPPKPGRCRGPEPLSRAVSCPQITATRRGPLRARPLRPLLDPTISRAPRFPLYNAQAIKKRAAQRSVSDRVHLLGQTDFLSSGETGSGAPLNCAEALTRAVKRPYITSTPAVGAGEHKRAPVKHHIDSCAAAVRKRLCLPEGPAPRVSAGRARRLLRSDRLADCRLQFSTEHTPII
jgi:hypothetical protein